MKSCLIQCGQFTLYKVVWESRYRHVQLYLPDVLKNTTRDNYVPCEKDASMLNFKYSIYVIE